LYEVVIYVHRDACFEAFPAENYVDYMTNVMPVPKSDIFYLRDRGKAVVCETAGVLNGIHRWSVRNFDLLLKNTMEIKIETERIEEVLDTLKELNEPVECELCENVFGFYL
jgi:hypothetical protein